VDRKNPFRCFDRRFLVQAIPALILLFGLALAGRTFARGTPARIAIAALLSVVTGYVIVISVATIRRLDEMQQRLHLEAIAISFTVTAVLATASEYMTKAGARLPTLDLGWWWPFMAFTWVGAVWVLSRRYR
jgi:hypothetical protein